MKLMKAVESDSVKSARKAKDKLHKARANFFFGPTCNLDFQKYELCACALLVINFDLYTLCIIIKAYAPRRGLSLHSEYSS